jgi:stage III sporulation protein AB
VGDGLTGVGCTAVVAGSTGMGLLVARQIRRRPAELGRLAAALERLRTEVEYGRTPLPRALRRAAGGEPGPAAALLCGAAAHLETGAGLSAAEAWERALADAAERSAWTAADVGEIARLGPVLGGSDAADQVRHVALLAARLRAAEAAAAAGAERQARMWCYLGLLCGLAAVLAVLP